MNTGINTNTGHPESGFQGQLLMSNNKWLLSSDFIEIIKKKRMSIIIELDGKFYAKVIDTENFNKSNKTPLNYFRNVATTLFIKSIDDVIQENDDDENE